MFRGSPSSYIRANFGAGRGREVKKAEVTWRGAGVDSRRFARFSCIGFLLEIYA